MYHFSSIDDVQVVGGHPVAQAVAREALANTMVTSAASEVTNAGLPERAATAEITI